MAGATMDFGQTEGKPNAAWGWLVAKEKSAKTLGYRVSPDHLKWITRPPA